MSFALTSLGRSDVCLRVTFQSIRTQSLRGVWNAFKKIAQNRTEKEKDLLFKETATVYRL